MREMTGGCQCGRVRYSAQVADDEAYLCHCRMCQRATGGVSIAFKNLAKAEVAWQHEPDWYASSEVATRPFCRECGTPLGFAFNTSDRIDLTVGSFDDPAPFYPTANFGIESKHAAWEDTSHLPSYKVTETASVIARWEEAGLEVPE